MTDALQFALTEPHEADGLLWVHALPQARTEKRGRIVDLTDPDRFAAIAGSLSEQFSGHHCPNFLIDAQLLGHERGDTLIAGVVRRSELKTQADLVKFGIEIEEPAGIFFGIELNDIGRQARDAKQLRFGSVAIAFDFPDRKLDDDGNPVRVWPAFASEFSATSQPHWTSLRPADDTQHVQFAADETPELSRVIGAAFDKRAAWEAEWASRAEVVEQFAKQAGVAAEDLTAMLSGAAPMAPNVVAALTSALAVGVVEVIRAAQADGVQFSTPAQQGTAVSTEETNVSPDTETAELRAELAALREANAAKDERLAKLEFAAETREHEAAVRAACAERKVFLDFSSDDGKATLNDLVAIRREDVGRFDRFLDRMPRDERDGSGRVATAPKQEPVDAVQFCASPRTPDEVAATAEAIRSYAAENNCSQSDARAALLRGA